MLIIVYVDCGYFSVVVVVVFGVFLLVLIIVVFHLLEELITAVQMWFKLKLSGSLTDLAVTMFVIIRQPYRFGNRHVCNCRLINSIFHTKFVGTLFIYILIYFYVPGCIVLFL